MKDVNPAPSKPAERERRLICREAKTLPAGRRSEIGTFGKPEAHFTVISAHPKEHRHGLIDRQACQPVISETPRGEGRDGYAGRVRQGPPQIVQYGTVKRPLGDFSVKVNLTDFRYGLEFLALID